MFRFLKRQGGKPETTDFMDEEAEGRDDEFLSSDALSDISDELSALKSSSYASITPGTGLHDDDDYGLESRVSAATSIERLNLNLDLDDDDADGNFTPPSVRAPEKRFSLESDSAGGEFDLAAGLGAVATGALGARAMKDSLAEDRPIMPSYRSSGSDKLVTSSHRLTELDGFTRSARSAAGQVGMAVQNLSKSHDALVNLTAFLPSIEAEFHRAEVLANEIKALHADNSAKEKLLSDLKTDLAITKKEVSDLRQTREGMAADLENLKSEMSQYSIAVAQLKKANSGLESDVAFERKKNASINDQLERQGSDISALETRNSELLSEIEVVGKNEAAIRREFDELQHRLDHESSTRQAIAIEHEKLKRDASRWRKELEELETQQEQVAAKMRAIEEDSKVRESRAQGEIFILKSETENLQSKLRLRDANEKTLQAQISELNQALRNADGAAKRARRELDEKQAELERSKKEIAELNTNLSEINLNYMSDLITLDNQKQQIEQFRQSLQALNQQNQKLAQYQQLYRSAEEQIAQMQTKISEYSRELKAAKFAGLNRPEPRYSRTGPEDVTLPSPSNGDPSDSKH